MHGDKYGYENVNYIGSRTKVNIICKIHGSFMQEPYIHNAGHGCPECGKRIKGTTESFIKKARKVHGNKYGYENVNYTDRRTKVNIICKIHGSFMQAPYIHNAGHGCPECGKMIKRRTKSFIKKASEVRIKVKIRCKMRGSFMQKDKKDN